MKVSPSRQQLAEQVYTRAVPNSRSDGEGSSSSPVGGRRKRRSEGRIWSSHWTGPRQYEQRSGTEQRAERFREDDEGGLDRKRGGWRGSRVYLAAGGR